MDVGSYERGYEKCTLCVLYSCLLRKTFCIVYNCKFNLICDEDNCLILNFKGKKSYQLASIHCYCYMGFFFFKLRINVFHKLKCCLQNVVQLCIVNKVYITQCST